MRGSISPTVMTMTVMKSAALIVPWIAIIPPIGRTATIVAGIMLMAKVMYTLHFLIQSMKLAAHSFAAAANFA